MLWRKPKSKPLLVFVHVPKTAGSAVNQYLKSWSKHGITHAERFEATPDKLIKQLDHIDWISGHLDLSKVENLISPRTGRTLQYYSLMRRPADQVASHYNWLIEIFHRGNRFYRGHSDAIKEISARLRASDNSDPTVVIQNLSRRPGLFANLQTRFIVGDDVDLTDQTCETRLKAYHSIQTDPQNLVQQMTGARPGTIQTANASAYHFDPKIFESDALKEFLDHFCSHDIKIFDQISRQNYD